MTLNTDHLRALLAAATPGPWMAGEGDPESILSTVNWHCLAQANDALPNMRDNAALIVALRNTAPALLAEVERLGKFEAMVKAAPTVAITECNQIAGASDFDFGDMTHAAQQFKPGQMVAIVPTSGATEES